MTPSADDYREAVANGAALLDARVPGWRDRVDVTTLKLSSCERCTLGQLFGHFDRGLIYLALDGERDAVYGFTLPFDDFPPGTDTIPHWEALRLAWWKQVMA